VRADPEKLRQILLNLLTNAIKFTPKGGRIDLRCGCDSSMVWIAVRDTGRSIVSGFVESPTFGGGSWLAHISFLTGLEIRDDESNMRLMTQQRETILTTFRGKGYKTIAVMPGMSQPWPEGSFYGFTDIYDYFRLDYKGPSFGWWDMPDQFTLAKLDEQELSREGRPPLFVFYPTVSTHTPFTPLAPYQPDWHKMLTPKPFTDEELDKAYVGEPDYMDLGPAYVDSVSYAYQTFAGYVRQRSGRGQHIPAANIDLVFQADRNGERRLRGFEFPVVGHNRLDPASFSGRQRNNPCAAPQFAGSDLPREAAEIQVGPVHVLHGEPQVRALNDRDGRGFQVFQQARPRVPRRFRPAGRDVDSIERAHRNEGCAGRLDPLQIL
jgi:hypothetical protein